MKILRSYIKTGWYNITHNRMYALFYSLGTAITFIFVIILLQIAHLVGGADAPFVNAARTVHVDSYFVDANGKFFWGLTPPEMDILFGGIPEVEQYSISNDEWGTAIINGSVRAAMVNFVDGNYFVQNRFEFEAGRAFTVEEVKNRQRLAIITENYEDRYFQGDALDKHIELQGVDYTVVGVVKNFSSLLNPYEQANVWLPYTFNKFVPSGNARYDIEILFKEGIPIETIKTTMCRALNRYFDESGKELTKTNNDILTIQEEKEQKLGGGMFTYGVALIMFVLMFIPALNIMTLSMANVQDRAREVALRRAVGATRLESFLQIVVENFMLVMIGLALALLMLKPVMGWLEKLFLGQSGSVTVLTGSGIGFMTILSAILLGVVFSILCGGIPAWVISKKSISVTLKGGEQ